MTAEERLEKRFSVGAAPRLLVSNVHGSITVDGEERDDIQVMAVKRLEGCQEPERTEVEMRQEGERVVVKTRYHDKGRGLIHRHGARVCVVDYEVCVPVSCDVTVNQVEGIVHVRGVMGQVEVSAVQGAVELCEIGGCTQVKAVSASVDGAGWSGRATVDTVSGAVQIAGAQLSQVKANTVSGSVAVETTIDEEGRYDFSSVSGDVTLYLPVGRGVESRGTTISGHLVCDLPVEFSRRGRGGWRATINGGGPAVGFNSVSGDLEVLAAKGQQD